MNILVCGGAGYIGSHMCKRLSRDGHVPITFDNLSTGHQWAVKWGPFVPGDLLDSESIAAVFRVHKIDAVMHFAALSIVSESVSDPARYFRNNVVGTLNLLDAMRLAGVSKIVFSSTAAVYGNPKYTPIDEMHPTQPINPYGWSKLLAERTIDQYCHAYDMRGVSLRYFNAAGACPEDGIGEAHEPETHLIPSAITAALNPTSPVHIFGNDYATPDGTCIRDYVHVLDIADAHLRALYSESTLPPFAAINLGGGSGTSVHEVIQETSKLLKKPITQYHEARRLGDPQILIAEISLARKLLQWEPSRTISCCIASAAAWQISRTPAGHGVK